MTRREFHNLLGSIKALSPEQMRQLRQQLDGELTHYDSEADGERTKQPVRTSPKEKRAKVSPAKLKRPLTPEEIDQYMLTTGLVARLPNPVEDIDDDDPDDEPVTIEGEPLSESIIRERR